MEGKITDINAVRKCPDCDGVHKLYQPCTAKLKSGLWKLHEEYVRLRTRCEQLEEIVRLQVELRGEIYGVLDWMITALDFTNRNTGMDAEDSPEMKSAKILRDKLKPEREVKVVEAE